MSLVRFFFFFSSRRRHTRFDCDWSSDVCSSDLINNVRRTYGSGARNDQHERAKNQGESFHSQILKKQHGRVNARSINYEGLLRLLPAVRYSGGTLGNQQGLTESPSAHGCDGSYQSPRSQSAMRPMAWSSSTLSWPKAGMRSLRLL